MKIESALVFHPSGGVRYERIIQLATAGFHFIRFTIEIQRQLD